MTEPATRIKLACFEPDIPQNIGSMIRLCACLNTQLHIIEPCGFAWDMRKLRAVAMDYLTLCAPIRHANFAQFRQWQTSFLPKPRLVLLSTKSATRYIDFEFQPDDVLLLGSESAGVPQAVREACDASVRIALHPSARSLNLVSAASMVLAEALRQTQGFAP